MHVNSYQLMLKMFDYHVIRNPERYPFGRKLDILDVGSMDVRGCGSYRDMFTFVNLQKNWTYKGLDIAPGRNVDIVANDPYKWPVEDASFDIVISGQCLEHVEAIWVWAKEIERVLKEDGLFFIVVPFEHPLHRFPVDCWRFLPDGLTFLFGKYCNFEILEVDIKVMDTYMAARKRKL